MKRTLVLLIVLTILFSAPVFAGTMSSIDESANSKDYVVKAPAMVVRGLSNIIMSPVEILGHSYKGTVEGKPLVGTLEGFGSGVMWGMDRLGRGAWDVVTALAPNYNGAPPTHKC